MTLSKKAMTGLEHCINGEDCTGCIYRDECMESYDVKPMLIDVRCYIKQLEEREWELFDLLSSVWHGKQYYFKQDDGTVYSRQSCKYMTFDQAIDEFAYELTGQRTDTQDALPEFQNGVRMLRFYRYDPKYGVVCETIPGPKED